MGIFIDHYKDPVIKQPGFNAKQEFFFFVTHIFQSAVVSGPKLVGAFGRSGEVRRFGTGPMFSGP